MVRVFLFFMLALFSIQSQAQQSSQWFSAAQAAGATYSFRCVTDGRTTGDSCDICPSTIVESRSFNGLLVLRGSTPWRWIDQPYSIRVKPGNVVEYWEHGVNPYNERLTIALSQTPFTTVQAMADSTFCNASTPGSYALFTASDSINDAPIFRGDTLTIVGRNLAQVTFDSLLNKYVINVDSIAGGGGGASSGNAITVTSGVVNWGGATTMNTVVTGNGTHTVHWGALGGIQFNSKNYFFLQNSRRFMHESGAHTAFGTDTLFNFFNGYLAGQDFGTSSTGYANTAIGTKAGRSLNGTAPNSSSNTIIGSGSGELITTGSFNTIVGTRAAGLAATTSTGLTAMGHHAGLNNAGDNNVMIGRSAGEAVTSGLVVAVGGFAGYVNTTGTQNTFVGNAAGRSNILGAQNTFVGHEAGFNSATSAGNGENTFMGYRAGLNNSTGTLNTFLGTQAGQANTTGVSNTYVGRTSGILSTGSDNAGLGLNSGSANTTGSRNTYLGRGAGSSGISTASDNILLGYDVNPATDISNVMMLGRAIYATTQNNITTSAVGIGTITPARKLHVQGEARITDLTTDTPTGIVGADADGDLGLLGLSGLSIVSGVLTNSSTGTVTSVSATAPAAGFDIAGSPITTSGTFVFTLDNDLAGVEGLSGTGFAVRTATDTWTTRAITSGTGISVVNGDGVASNPQIINTAPDQTVTIVGSTGTYPNFTVNDASATNEGALSVGAGGANSSTINSNTSGSTPVTIEGINGVLVTESGSTISIAPPVGTDRQTLRYNSSGVLLADSEIQNNGTEVGINIAPVGGTELYVNGFTRVDGSIASVGTGTATGGTASPTVRLVNTTPTTGDIWYLHSADNGEFQLHGGNSSETLVGEPDGTIFANYDFGIGFLTGTPTQMIGTNGAGIVGPLSLGAGLSITSGTLNVSAGNNYQTWRDDGTLAVQRPNANFVSSTRISTLLTDDAGATETEVSHDIIANSVDNTRIRQGLAKSVIGVTGNATANVADIAATVADQVLVNNTANTAVSWGTVATNGITNNAVTDAKLRQGVARSVIGVTGNATANVANIQGTADQVLRVTTAGTALAFGTVATGGITNSAVTYAKIQNAAANNVLLGNNNGAGTAYEEITMAALQTMAGYVDGVGVAGRHAYWTDANTLSNDADNLWDATNNRMTISNTVAGVGSGLAGLNVQSGAQTGPQEMIRMSGNVNGNMIMPLTNASNLAGSNVFHQIIVGGSAAGDPFIQYTITGGLTTSVGVDNSDGDKFKISPNASTPGQNVNNGIIITQDAVADVGINKDAPIHPLDVGGVARAVQFRNTGNEWNNSNIVFGTGAGTGATIGSVSGGSNGWQVNFNTGTSPVLDGTIFTATFPNPFGSLTYSTMEGRGVPGGINFNNERVKFVLSSESATTLVLRANGTLTASTQYAINFSTAGY